MLRTKEQYHEDLFSMRPNIYIGGECVGRDDPRIRPGINVLDVTFDLARYLAGVDADLEDTAMRKMAPNW